MKTDKTNAMRILDTHSVSYEAREYDPEALNGEDVAAQLNENPDCVFKTLVLKGDYGILVCCIPVNLELDLKKVARVSNNKRVEMLPLKDLTTVTGYVRGGCSPIGMKKQFPTFVHESALTFDSIMLSAGRRGTQIVVNPKDLIELIKAKTGDLVKNQP